MSGHRKIAKLFRAAGVWTGMGWVKRGSIEVSLLAAVLTCQAGLLPAQQTEAVTGDSGTAAVRTEEMQHSILNWTPPSLAALGEQAEVKNSFVLDRTALGAMAALMPDSDAQVRPAIRKLDGIGVHLYRFNGYGQIDAAQVEQVKRAYRARGWKHLVSGDGHGDPNHKTTDLWLVVDGVEVRGGAMLVVTPRTVSLVTFTGDLNPIDLLHLRGHFGIPAASGDGVRETR